VCVCGSVCLSACVFVLYVRPVNILVVVSNVILFAAVVARCRLLCSPFGFASRIVLSVRCEWYRRENTKQWTRGTLCGVMSTLYLYDFLSCQSRKEPRQRTHTNIELFGVRFTFNFQSTFASLLQLLCCGWSSCMVLRPRFQSVFNLSRWSIGVIGELLRECRLSSRLHCCFSEPKRLPSIDLLDCV